mmetsp:Transcript_30400/g.98665  ORF Transcript_30400/g.98665 Transcript_30400/m.98665 type:complete len:108 (-) Transcript_30400:126-449(-)
MSSKTSARRPVGWSYNTSSSVMICAWGDKRRNAWISRRLFTCEDNEPWRLKEARLVNRIKMVFHAFDSMVLAILDILGFQNLAECAFTLLRHESILAHSARYSLIRE